LWQALFIGILYQQAFHLASCIFGAWQIGVGVDYQCYYGDPASLFVSLVLMLFSFLLGGYVVGLLTTSGCYVCMLILISFFSISRLDVAKRIRVSAGPHSK
jgi:hypothetical protein